MSLGPVFFFFFLHEWMSFLPSPVIHGSQWLPVSRYLKREMTKQSTMANVFLCEEMQDRDNTNIKWTTSLWKASDVLDKSIFFSIFSMNILQYLALMAFGIKLSSVITWTASYVENGYTTVPSACFWRDFYACKRWIIDVMWKTSEAVLVRNGQQIAHSAQNKRDRDRNIFISFFLFELNLSRK